MRRRAAALLVAALLVAAAALAAAAAAAKAAAPAFVGRWRARARVLGGKRSPIPPEVKIVVVFARGGAYRSTQALKHGHEDHRTVRRGRWRLEGRTLVVKVGAQTDRMRYRVRGRTLTLTQLDRHRAGLVLTRQR